LKRKGFTLIELMVVIAIIIILAAIAIPNYLKMTERAKRSRLASDYATLATVLETFKTDWGKYPTAAAVQAINVTTTVIHTELSAAGTGTAVLNKAGSYNAVGEVGPIEYIKQGTLTSIVNPFIATNNVSYGSTDGDNWVIYAQIESAKWLYRTDGSSSVSEAASAPAIP
jgi:prepilin-type N-terminal cleavage/methylation domain-containing protein